MLLVQKRGQLAGCYKKPIQVIYLLSYRGAHVCLPPKAGTFADLQQAQLVSSSSTLVSR